MTGQTTDTADANAHEGSEAGRPGELDSSTAEPNAAEGSAEPETIDQADDGKDREAAKFRRRLRATEQDFAAYRTEAEERDAANNALIDTLRQAHIEDHLRQYDNHHTINGKGWRFDPEFLWNNGTQINDLLAEDGTVDTEAVTLALSRACDRRGIPDPTRIGYSVDHSQTTTPPAPVTSPQDEFLGSLQPQRLRARR